MRKVPWTQSSKNYVGKKQINQNLTVSFFADNRAMTRDFPLEVSWCGKPPSSTANWKDLVQTDGWPESPVELIKGDGRSARAFEEFAERTVVSTFRYTEFSVIFPSCKGQARVKIQDGARSAFPSAQCLPTRSEGSSASATERLWVQTLDINPTQLLPHPIHRNIATNPITTSLKPVNTLT
jgi:hypothetical protein